MGSCSNVSKSKSNDLSVNTTNDRNSKEYKLLYKNVDTGQKKLLDRIKEQLPVGGRAISNFGGTGQIQDMSFKMFDDGTIEVTTTAVAYIPHSKSETIGVGDIQEALRTTTTVTEILRGEGEGRRHVKRDSNSTVRKPTKEERKKYKNTNAQLIWG